MKPFVSIRRPATYQQAYNLNYVLRSCRNSWWRCLATRAGSCRKTVAVRDGTRNQYPIPWDISEIWVG